MGVALGLAAGLIYTWGIQPVEFYDTYPPLMREDFRADWIRMTALAYAYDGDLERAHLRLQRLAPEEIRHELGKIGTNVNQIALAANRGRSPMVAENARREHRPIQPVARLQRCRAAGRSVR